jgi:hypothetical protein
VAQRDKILESCADVITQLMLPCHSANGFSNFSRPDMVAVTSHNRLSCIVSFPICAHTSTYQSMRKLNLIDQADTRAHHNRYSSKTGDVKPSMSKWQLYGSMVEILKSDTSPRVL